MSQCKLPFCLGGGPGEGTLFVAEPLTLQKSFGQRGATHSNEWLLCAIAGEMDCPRHQFPVRFLLESVAVLSRLETSWVRERISSMQDVANMVIAFGLFDGRGGTFLMVAIRNLYWTERITAFIVGGLIPAPTIW
jgi:hypothetical protein